MKNTINTIDTAAVMSRAWSIRKAAAAALACRPSEVLMSECLRMAWSESAPSRAAVRVVREWQRLNSDAQYNYIVRVVVKALQKSPRAALTGCGSDPDAIDTLVNETFCAFAPALNVEAVARLNTARAARGLRPISLVHLIYRAANAAIERVAYANKNRAAHEVAAAVQTAEEEEADLMDLKHADRMEKDNCGIVRETENLVMSRYSLDAIRAVLDGRDETDRTITAMVMTGHTERAIAEAVHMSHQAVHKRLMKLRAAFDAAIA